MGGACALVLTASFVGTPAREPEVDARGGALDAHGASAARPWVYLGEEEAFVLRHAVQVDAPCERVWGVLIEAEAWSAWGPARPDGESPGPGGRLAAGAAFTWRPLGLDLTSTVIEHVQPHRLSWQSRASDLGGYHAWHLRPVDHASEVVPPAIQSGRAPWTHRPDLPDALHDLHEVWLAAIKQQAEARSRAGRG